MRPELLALALVAGAALAFEVLLTRLLAIVHWHHFAGMVISLALLGYGMSGSVLTPLLPRLRGHATTAFAAAATLFGVAAAAVVAIAQAVPFNAPEVVWNPRQWLWLALLYLLFTLPFFFAAGCTALALACFPVPIGRIYRFDLVGAGTGALAVVGLLGLLRPDHALPLIAALGPLAAMIVLARQRRRLVLVPAMTLVALVVLAVIGWPGLRISAFKPLPQTLQIAGTAIVAERTSPISLVDVVASELIPFRAVSGLSLTNVQEPAAQLGLFVDGDGPSPITAVTGDPAALAYLDATLAALPYRLLQRPRVLLLGLGGGGDLMLALRHDAAAVDVVEPDATVAGLLRGELAGFTGNMLARPEVRLHVDAARRFAAAAAGPYDLIGLHPQAGGRGTLAESFATTVEAFTACLASLVPEGLLVLPHALQLPPRASLKLALTALAALERLDAAAPSRHLVLLRAWDQALLLVRRTPFDAGTLAAIEASARTLAFDLGWHPDMERDAANRFNLLPEPLFFDAMAAVTGPDRAAFIDAYAFDIRPATDDRPYFHDFFRWRALPDLWATARGGNAGLLDWGWPVQFATLALATLLAGLLILLPAHWLARGAASRPRAAVGGYFLLIGVGFIFTEIAVMQRLVLLLGQPVHAFAVTLAAFLVFAGLGSGVSARLGPDTMRRDPFAVIVPAIAALALAHILAGPWLLEFAASLPAASRFALAIGLIAPLAFAMGLPFPLVLARLKAAAPALVPWAWGVNGCASVIGAVLAGLVAMSAGITALALLAVLAYALAALVQRRIRPPAGRQPHGPELPP